MGIIILKTDGTITHTDFPTGTIREQTKGLAALIGCKYIERVHPANAIRNLHFPRGVSMIVDEEGALKEDKVINHLASILYGDEIYGAVLFCGEEFTDDGPAFCSMDSNEQKDVEIVLEAIKEIDAGKMEENLSKIIGSLEGEITITFGDHEARIECDVSHPTAFAYAAYVILSSCEKEFDIDFDRSLEAVVAMNKLLDCSSTRKEMTISVAELLRGMNNGQQSSGTEEQKEG